MRHLTLTILTLASVLVLVLIAIATTMEGAFTVLFGWIPFLGRVVPQVKPDGPSVVVGTLAVLLFSAGVHWLGRSWRGTASPSNVRWRSRWTVAVVLGVLILFTAGISVIGITHQVAWLATSQQPIVGEALKRRDSLGLRMTGMSLHSYHDANGIFPPGGTFTKNGELLHSWETHILPYMGYSTSWIDMERPWDDLENQKYFKCVIGSFINPEYRTPALEDGNGYGLSHYAANSKVLSANKSTQLKDITNGASNTILIGEVNAGFKPWGHPINWRDPAAGLNQGTNTFGGPPGTSGVNFLMADGSIRFLSNSTDPAVLRALSNPRGDE